MNSVEIINKQAEEYARAYVKVGALEPEWYSEQGFRKGATRTVTAEEIEAAHKLLRGALINGGGQGHQGLTNCVNVILRAVGLQVPE